jgi:hypothetical protein
MKVTGFTFIKNAEIYDYPIVEAITSILPICDACVVAVGKSKDQTLQRIQNIGSPKISILETEWDETAREGGKVLAMETDKALAQIARDSDWAFYIQGDEVVHENYLETIQQAMRKYKDDMRVDGLLFKYIHFYGSYQYVGNSSKWYTHEIRIVRPHIGVYSYRDAQGFRKNNNEKLNVKEIDAYVYHYGWVKEPAIMQEKQKTFNALWHDDAWIEKHVGKEEKYDYLRKPIYLKPFTGSHPLVMKDRIARANWAFNYNASLYKKARKDWWKDLLKKYTGITLGYKNYKKI